MITGRDGKGEAWMGILDNVKGAANRGTATAGRAAERLRINTQLSDLERRRKGLAAQLGAALYVATKDDPAFSGGEQKSLYEAIGRCDAERAVCQKRLDQIDAAERAQALEAKTFTCVLCGSQMSERDLFCSGCGASADKARPAPSVSKTTASACPTCGASVGKNDLFCFDCGFRLAAPANEGKANLPSSDSDGGEMQLVCSDCGEPFEEGDAFCMHCGRALAVGHGDKAAAE